MAAEATATDGTGGRLPAIGFLMLASLGLFWGLNWPGMKIALNELPVWWFRVISVTAGGLGLLAVSAVMRLRVLPTRAELVPLLTCTVFAIIGWHVMTGYGVSLMPAGRASIIAFTMPVWAALFASWILGEAITGLKIFGLALGMAGLGVLIGPDLMALGAAPDGAAFMLCAAISWAFGTVLFKRFSWTSPIASLIGWQLMLGAIPITIGALILEPVPNFSALSDKVWWALAYLIALPMIYCQWAYFYVVKIFPAAIAAIGTLAVPIVGTFSSAWLLGETVGWAEILALLLISAALFVVLVLPVMGRGK
ncbi:MAG: DMT family transporter [Pseudomonadota bacterium]